MMRILRGTKKPVVLAANKVDGPSGEADAAMLWSLGLGEPYPVSALHGRDLHQYLVLRGGIRAEESFVAWCDEVITALRKDNR